MDEGMIGFSAASSPQNCGKEPNHTLVHLIRSAVSCHTQDLLMLALGLPILGARARRCVGPNILADNSNEENCDVGFFWFLGGYSVLA